MSIGIVQIYNIILLSCFPDMRDYAVPDVTKSALVVSLPPIYPPQPPIRGQGLMNPLDLAPPTYDALYAAADVVSSHALNIPNLQVCIHCIILGPLC